MSLIFSETEMQVGIFPASDKNIGKFPTLLNNNKQKINVITQFTRSSFSAGRSTHCYDA